MTVNMNGFSPSTDGSVNTAEPTELSIDQKLDYIMEAVAFQTKILASALIALDKRMQQEQPQSKIIKPIT